MTLTGYPTDSAVGRDMDAFCFCFSLLQAIFIFTRLAFICFCCMSCILTERPLFYPFVIFHSLKFVVNVIVVVDYLRYLCFDADRSTWRACLDVLVV